jgi:DNA-binding response OmpR family regulator
MKILMLAEPDRVCGGREVLEREDCCVEVVADIASAVARAGRCHFEVVTIDLDQVRLAPAEVVGLLRQVTDAPLLLTRRFVDDVDQIVALEAGADAVAAQPLSPRLLLAHFRRLRRLARERAVPGLHAAEYGPLKIDPARRRVTWRERPVELCGSELTIVSVLAAARGRPVSRDDLLQTLGRPASLSRALNTAISRIRARLQRQGIDEIRIQAVSRSGYRLVLCLEHVDAEARARLQLPVRSFAARP